MVDRVLPEPVPYWNSDMIGLRSLLRGVADGTIRRAPWQQPASWSDGQAVDLLETVLLGMPMGSVTVCDERNWDAAALPSLAGSQHGPGSGETRPVVLADGERRLMTLLGALLLGPPMPVRDDGGRTGHRLHYLDIRKALDGSVPLRDAILSAGVTGDGQPVDGSLDLRGPDAQVAAMVFPLQRSFDFIAWRDEFLDAWMRSPAGGGSRSGVQDMCMEFEYRVVRTLHDYRVPVCTISGGTPAQLRRMYKHSDGKRRLGRQDPALVA